MTKDISSSLNDIFEEEKPKKEKKKKEKTEKKEQKRRKQREQEIEKIEDEEFLKIKDKDEHEELFLTNIMNLEEDPLPPKPKEKKVASRSKKEKVNEENKPEITSRLEKTRNLDPIDKKEKTPFFTIVYDTFFGFFLITLFLVSTAYFAIQLKQYTSWKDLFAPASLMIGLFCYILSFVCQKEGSKKLFGILSSIALCGFMVLTLYWA